MIDKKLLLPREQYEEESKKYGERPFTFELEKNGQMLFYFGANHSHDPQNHQYHILKKYWQRFIQETKGKDRIVLVEGGKRRIREDEYQAIVKGSEGELVTLWADKANIEIDSPEPGHKFIRENLSQYSAKVILLYWFLGRVDNYQRYADPKPNFEEEAEIWYQDYSRAEAWRDVEFSIEELKKLYKEIMDKEFSEKESPNALVNPNNTGTIINDIAREVSDLRELKIVSEIEKYWKEGKNIFVVYGSGHLIIQRPALEELLT